MSLLHFWLGLSMILTMAAYGCYWWGIKKQLVRPNRSSWLIWSAVTTIEALTYQAVNEGLLQNIIFFMNAASCLFITFAVWRQSSWQRPSLPEYICMALSLGAMILWLGFHEQLWAHLIVVAAVPLGFLPTWFSAWEDKRREMSPAWGLWALADFSTLVLIAQTRTADGMDLPYILVELVCHVLVWLIIGIPSINPWRSVGVTSGHFRIRDVDKSGDNPFKVSQSKSGKAVYATRSFPIGAILMNFTGQRYHVSEILAHRYGEEDRFVQIGIDTYMGPSGDIDDLVNHSCNPNAGLQFNGEEIVLVAIKPVQKGEEICWDYSTTSSSSAFWMRCMCGSHNCRGVIGDFEFLEADLQESYRNRRLVPPYLQSESAKLVPPSADTMAA
jgi:hypothetical protein